MKKIYEETEREHLGAFLNSNTLLYIEEPGLRHYIYAACGMNARQDDASGMQKDIKTDGNNKTRQTKLNNYKR